MTDVFLTMAQALTDDRPVWVPTTGTSMSSLIGYVLLVLGLWQVFKKVGIEPWYAIIPIVNVWGILRVAGKEWWWLLLFLIPIVNIVLALIVALDIGRKFGKGGFFSFFLLFLFPVVGYLIIGFGSSRYNVHA